MRIFGSIESQTESTFLFLYIIIFQKIGVFCEQIDRKWQWRVMQISEQNDFTPNKSKEVSLQKLNLGANSYMPQFH